MEPNKLCTFGLLFAMTFSIIALIVALTVNFDAGEEILKVGLVGLGLAIGSKL